MAKFLRIYRDFSGGLSEAANDNIKDNELVEARNIMPGDGYGITRACGTTIAYSPIANVDYPQLNKVVRLFEGTMYNGQTILSAWYSMPDGLEAWWRYNAATDSWGLVNWEMLAIKDWFFYAGYIYWLDGEALWRFTGRVSSTVSLAPMGDTATDEEQALWEKVKKAIAVEQRGQRWFYATTDNEIIFSEVGYPNKFNPTNIINVSGKTGDTITALHEFNEGLLIFMKHSVYYLAGWDFASGSDIRLYNLNTSSGTAFPRSVCTADNGVFYLGSNGVYRISLSSQTLAVVSENISEGKISGRLYNEGTILDAHAIVWDNAYYLSVEKEIPQTTESGSTYTTTVEYEYRYLFKEKAFFGEFTQGSSCYAIGLGGENALFMGCANGYILRYDPNSCNYIDPLTGESIAIDAVARTKCYDIAGSLAQEVRLQRLEVAARQFSDESSSFTLQIQADYDALAWNTELEWNANTDESLVYGEGLLGVGVWGWQDTVTKEMVVRRRCKRLQFIITGDTTGEPLLIYGFAVLCRKKRVKGSRRGVSAASASPGTDQGGGTG